MTLNTNPNYANWQRLIKDWQTSGLSQMAYCRQHHLEYHQFKYYRKRFLAIDAAQKVVTMAPAKRSPTVFAPVKLKQNSSLAISTHQPLIAIKSKASSSEKPLGVALMLELQPGLRLSIPDSCTLSQLKEILEALQSC